MTSGLSTAQLLKAVVRRMGSFAFVRLPEGRLKFALRAMIAAAVSSVPPEFLANPGETVVLIGFHRIDSVMLWSHVVGKGGKVVLIEAVPSYIQNIQVNLKHHLDWPIDNIIYVNKGVGAGKGQARLQIGRRADFTKVADQSIDDQLPASDFVEDIDIELESVDQILADLEIDAVDHVHMTISGMELEALRGMQRTLRQPRLRVYIRSLHTKAGELLYPQVVDLLTRDGMRVCQGRATRRFKGRNVYAARLAGARAH
jgi:FkbM family methyltransferase